MQLWKYIDFPFFLLFKKIKAKKTLSTVFLATLILRLVTFNKKPAGKNKI